MLGRSARPAYCGRDGVSRPMGGRGAPRRGAGGGGGGPRRRGAESGSVVLGCPRARGSRGRSGGRGVATRRACPGAAGRRGARRGPATTQRRARPRRRRARKIRRRLYTWSGSFASFAPTKIACPPPNRMGRSSTLPAKVLTCRLRRSGPATLPSVSTAAARTAWISPSSSIAPGAIHRPTPSSVAPIAQPTAPTVHTRWMSTHRKISSRSPW